RRRAVRQHDVLHEAHEVAVVFPEAAHVSLAWIGKLPLRTALTAPIHGGDGEAAAAQVGDDLEIFFDELGPAAKQADRAASRHARRIPARKAQLRAVIAAERPDGSPARDGVLGERYQLHGRSSTAQGDSSPPSYRRGRLTPLRSTADGLETE